MQDMIDYLLKHKDDAGKLPHGQIDPSKHTQGEDIHIPDTVDCFQDLMEEIDKGMDNFSKGQLEIETIWGQVQEKGQCTAYHAHKDYFRPPTGRDLSFVFYLQANEDSGHLKFPIYIHEVDYSKTIVPNTGGLIVFPAHLPHFTLKNNSDIPRIVISGNYREKGFKESRPNGKNETK